MNYSEAREYVNNASARGIVPGLTNISRLCALLGNPQDKLKIIHIAGTNGKGSTGAFIESVLRAAGMRTGHFSSPAVFSYREQFRINGESVSEERYASAVSEIKRAVDAADGLFPTAFETETAAAFLIFLAEDCDIAVIEAGMGGAEDATNVIKSSLVSVITPIALDHSRFLGNSIEDIAAAKAGIIKENGTVVTAPQEDAVMRVIRREAESKNARLFISGADTEYEISLLGAYQRQNAALAAEVCRHADGISEDDIARGLKSTVWRGRFEKICAEPEIIIDGAHNPHGALALTESIDKYFNGRRIIYIVGVFADKDYAKIAEITAPRAEKIYTISTDAPRGLDAATLAETYKKFNPNTEAVTLERALRLCLAETDTVTVAFGSLSFLGELSDKLGELSRMRKCSKILNDAQFRSYLCDIAAAESDRVYCKHGIEHLMDVARAGQIINLENGLGIPKEIVYGAALMHDIGRYAQYSSGEEHHTASARAAREILPRCGYTPDEVSLIAEAVREHRRPSDRIKTLTDVIAAADKETRMCMLCEASASCKWTDSEKNKNLII